MAKQKEKDEDKRELNIFESGIVPRHEIMSGEEKAELLEKLNIAPRQMPRIMEDDPAAKALGAKRGDMLRIMRKSPIGTESYYYRVVI